VFCKTFLSYIGFDKSNIILILQRSSIILGILAIWFVYDKLFKNKDVSNTKIYSLFQYTFFIYAFHEPMINIVKKILYFFMGTNEFNSFIIYLLAPSITLFFALMVAFSLKNISPGFYKIITGRR
jgi:hypothetical protein